MAMVQRDGSGEEALNGVEGKQEGVAEEEEECAVEGAEQGAATTVTAQSSMEEGSSGHSSSSRSSSLGDVKAVGEQGEEEAEGGAPKEEKDPGPPRHQYSKAELLKLRNGDHQRPLCLDPAYNNLSGMWDPERWFLGKRRGSSASPTEEAAQSTAGGSGGVAPASSSSSGGGGQAAQQPPRGSGKRERLDSEGGEGGGSAPLGGPKRRSSTDPKERLAREERDDLVLSPQRRSFGTGCHVSQPPQRTTAASESGPNKDDQGGLLHREPPSRRIGSGRILRDQRDWDRENREYGYGGGRRFDDSSHSGGGGGGHSNRYGRRGRDERIEEEEEPEWFVGGPTSQHDTIELVGFEEDPEMSRRTARRMRRCRDFASRKQQNNGPAPDQESQQKAEQKQQQQYDQSTGVSSSSHCSSSSSAAGSTSAGTASSSAGPSVASKLKRTDSQEDSSGTGTMDLSKLSGDGPGVTSTPLVTSPTLPDSVGPAPPALPAQDGFDFNDIFKADWCPRFLSDDVLTETEVGAPSGGSRFSQWFRRDSPPLSSDPQLAPPLDSGLLAALSGGGGEDGHRRGEHHHQQQQQQENDLASRILASAGVCGGGSMLGVPGPDSYFTPISPALPQQQQQLSPPPVHRDGPSSKNILDILMDANINVEAHMLNGDAAKSAQLRQHALSGKAKSVEELEADLKQVVLGTTGMHVRQQQHHRPQQQHQLHPHPQQQQHHHHHPVPILNLPQQQQQQRDQQQQHLQGLLNKLGAHPPSGHTGATLVAPPSLPERALQEEDLLRAQLPPSSPLHQHHHHQQQQPQHGMARVGGGDALLQQQQQGLLSHLLRPKAPPVIAQPPVPQQGQDVLVKILAGMGPVSPNLQPPPLGHPHHQPLSPPTTAHLLAARHDPMAAAAAMLRQQQHQQQEMLNSLLKPPVVTTQRPSPTQQLGLLAPCPSPLPPQDPRRVPSPLVFGQHPSPIPPVAGPTPGAPVQSSNTLQVHNAGLRPRVPSPQELAVHTQSILQTALLKKILEDQKQKENLRKQQEAQRARSPTTTQGGPAATRGASPSKGLSPTMAAFTPTSVMRKMHMERQDHPKGGDKGGPKANGEVGDGPPSQQQRMGNGTASSSRPPQTLGRAIKGNQGAPVPPVSADAKGMHPPKQFPQQHQAAGSLMRGSMEGDVMATFLEQQRLLQLQQQQRAPPPPPGVLGLVRPPQGPHHHHHPAIKLPGMMRPAGGPPPPAAAASAPPPMGPPRTHVGAAAGLKGVAAAAGAANPRGGPSMEMLQQALAQGLHPLAFQQLLLGGAAAPPGVGATAAPFGAPLHPAQAGHPFAPTASGPRDAKGGPGGLMPGGLGGRAGGVVPPGAMPGGPAGMAPANLAKWFGSDVLYQPTLPPVPHQKALLVEEVERQQQQATAVKN
ncbi:uncharacterized protein LOC144146124 isoform X2 [Haemaphysalis longicornis]